MGVTIKDIAALANTSTATVSRALSNKPGVTEAKRKRIQTLAGKLGFSPNRIAQNLALQKSHVLGLVAADLHNPFYIDFFRRIQNHVEDIGYQVLIADSEQSLEKEKHNINLMRQHRAEGLIIFPVHDWRIHTDVSHFLELRVRQFPFVIVGKLNEASFDSVTNEEVKTAQLVAQHLLDLGHRRIGFIGADAENRPVCERLEGVRKALAAANLELEDKHIVRHYPGWPEDMIRMLKRKDRPTALVMINDVLALMAQRPLAEAKIRVPHDLSMAAFGNNLWAAHLVPSLTTTAENNEEVARVAMELLFKRIEEPGRAPLTHLVNPEFLRRESTAPPPKV